MKAPLARADSPSGALAGQRGANSSHSRDRGSAVWPRRDMDDGVRRRTRPVTKRSRPSAYTSWHLAALRPGARRISKPYHTQARGSRRDVLHRLARPAPSGARPRARVQMGHPSGARFAGVAQLRLNSGQYADISPPRFHIIERASAARATHGDPSNEVSSFDRHPVAGRIELFSAAPFKTTNLF